MIISVNKPKDMTSRDVVNILVKKFNNKKIGHTGTLDPIATGVLVCCIGHDTKLVDIITSNKKEYIATMKLGLLTDTLDITGNIIDKKDYNVSKDMVISTLNSFVGDIEQVIPIYSAVKVNGKRLYEYARENISVELPKRKVSIYNIELLLFDKDIIKFKCLVSKGTYIRSLINDIANKLDTYGVMLELERTKQGIFNIEDSNSIDDVLSDNYNVISYEDLFSDIDKVEVNDIDYKKVSNGCVMEYNKDVIYTYKGKYIALYNNNHMKFLF